SEPDALDVRRREPGQLFAALGGRKNNEAQFTGKDLFVNGDGKIVGSPDVKSDIVEGELVERLGTRRLEAKAQGGASAEVGRKVQLLEVASEITRFENTNRQEANVVGGLENRGCLFAFAEIAFESR